MKDMETSSINANNKDECLLFRQTTHDVFLDLLFVITEQTISFVQCIGLGYIFN